MVHQSLPPKDGPARANRGLVKLLEQWSSEPPLGPEDTFPDDIPDEPLQPDPTSELAGLPPAPGALGEQMMETSVRKLFERYESLFNRSLVGGTDLDEIEALYASEFIAASPAGVMAGKNDDQLKQEMAQGYARYRAMGTKEMRLRNVRLSPINEHHCVAHVAWTAIYARQDQPDVAIDFDVHYFVQKLDREPKVFGWVSEDEQALQRQHGII